MLVIGLVLAFEFLLLLIGLMLFTYAQLKKERKSNRMLRSLLAEYRQLSSISQKQRQEAFNDQAEADNDANLLADFLEQELTKTRERIKQLSHQQDVNINPDDPEELQATTLRALFLEAEQAALNRQQNSDSFWHTFEDLLQKIIEAYQQKVDALPPKEAEQMQKRLDLYKQRIEALRHFQDDFMMTNAALRRAEEEIARLKNVGTADLDNLSHLDNLVEGACQLQQGLADTESSNPEAPINLVVEEEAGGDHNTPAPTLPEVALPAFSQSLERSDEEIQRLQEICTEQRELIQQLKREVQDLAVNSDGDATVAPEMVEKLQRCVAESEMCILVLEEEVARLQEQVHSLEQAQLGLPDVTAEESVDVAESEAHQQAFTELEALKKKHQRLKDRSELINQSSKDNTRLVKFARELVACENLYVMAESVLSVLTGYGFQGCLMLNGENQTVFASSDGAVDSKDKNLLTSLKSNQRVTNLGGNAMIEYPGLKLLIKNLNTTESTELGGRAKDGMVIVAELAEEKIIGLNTLTDLNSHKTELDSMINSSKRAINNINIQFQYQINEGALILTELMKSMNFALSTDNITPAQEERIEQILASSQQRFDLLFSNQDVMTRSFEELMAIMGDR